MNLETLSLWDNKLTGPIPPELGNLTSLSYLGVSGNEGLSGALPTTLTALERPLSANAAGDMEG